MQVIQLITRWNFNFNELLKVLILLNEGGKGVLTPDFKGTSHKKYFLGIMSFKRWEKKSCYISIDEIDELLSDILISQFEPHNMRLWIYFNCLQSIILASF